MKMEALKEFVRNVLKKIKPHKNRLLGALFFLYVLRKLYKISQSRPSFQLLHPPQSDAKAHQAYQLDVHERIYPHILVNSKDMWLHTRQWLYTPGTPKGVIFLCHGFGEHIGRYEPVARAFNQQGFICFGMDHQGHGQSQGDRAYVERVWDFVDDYMYFIHRTQATLTECKLGLTPAGEPLPTFLFGHSMGGLISILVSHRCELQQQMPQQAIDHALYGHARVWPFRGTILSAPLVQARAEDATPINVALGKLLTRLVPKLGFLPLTGVVSGHETVVGRYYDDILNYDGFTRIRIGVELLRGIDHVRQEAKKMHFPFLMLQGQRDSLVEPQGAEWFYNNASSPDKTLKTYQEGFHELMFDTVGREVLQDVLTWIDGHMP